MQAQSEKLQAQGEQLRVLQQAGCQRPEIGFNGPDKRLAGHSHGSDSSVSVTHGSSPPSTINSYLGIIAAPLSDSAKTSCLCAMLREEVSAEIISCFAGAEGKWNTTARQFDGVPLWPLVADKVVAVNSGVHVNIHTYFDTCMRMKHTDTLTICESQRKMSAQATCVHVRKCLKAQRASSPWVVFRCRRPPQSEVCVYTFTFVPYGNGACLLKPCPLQGGPARLNRQTFKSDVVFWWKPHLEYVYVIDNLCISS
jgi:hypothetical protein